ncbi:hypothetical protein TNCV_1890481 [Trichonephila clavipes]|nr:hypothetical protein TNCV_1890481 [Trichonephila clavipes]
MLPILLNQANACLFVFSPARPCASSGAKSEHDFVDAQTTDHEVVGDATEINSANHQTLVVENQHINPSEEPELMANSNFDATKKFVSVFI